MQGIGIFEGGNGQVGGSGFQKEAGIQKYEKTVP